IAQGLVYTQSLEPDNIYVSDIDHHQLKKLAESGIQTSTENQWVCQQKPDIIILAVKPWLIENVLDNIKDQVSQDQIIISIAAGVQLSTLEAKLGPEQPLMIAIPNTAISIGESVTSLATHSVTGNHLDAVIALFNQMGTSLLLDESSLKAATILASCGIAFAFRFLRAATEGGVESGLKPSIAAKMAAQVMKGAAEMIQFYDSHPEEEIDKVTTPKGITIVGLNEMEENGFSGAVIKGMRRSFQKLS
ncbi:MAG: pyrroline-5-carboxylate reductase family protein, partial [Bacteroidota bacterium]